MLLRDEKKRIYKKFIKLKYWMLKKMLMVVIRYLIVILEQA